ncbi:MAG: YcbK family protein [Candidatus Binatia bacterium]
MPIGLRAAVIFVCVAVPAWADGTARFYFSGDGAIRMGHAHRDDTLEVRYRDTGGNYDAEALARIARFFRSRTDGLSAPMSLRLIELIDFIEDEYHPKRLILVSGYRSPELNAALRADGRRVAPASLHTEGLAADVQLTGLDLRRLWKQLRTAKVGGVGLYERDGFLHVDAGRPRFWEAATAGIDQNFAKENGRVFARTDFDRYADLAGARVRLHSVTALPIGVRRVARVGDAPLAIAPLDAAIRAEGDCWLIAEPAERYEFAVATPAAPAARAPIRLETCAPRIGATPEEILTNPVERLSGH